jgi:hypothetical protein
MNITKKDYDVTASRQVAVQPDETTTKNLSLVPTQVTVSGHTWLDVNENGIRDANESVPNVPVDFTVLDAPDQNAKNATKRSNETGYYTKDLSPGTYRVSVNITANETRYVYTRTITIEIGDAPMTMDIKIARVE